MFSKELDRNTVKYMIEEQQKVIDELKQKLKERDSVITVLQDKLQEKKEI